MICYSFLWMCVCVLLLLSFEKLFASDQELRRDVGENPGKPRLHLAQRGK